MRATRLSFQGKRKGQHGQQHPLFVNLLAATTSIPTPILLEWTHSYFEVLLAVVTILHENMESPPFSFHVNPAPLFHGRDPLVETDERSVTTDYRADSFNKAHMRAILPSLRGMVVPAPA
jgi:hypothetical protein